MRGEFGFQAERLEWDYSPPASVAAFGIFHTGQGIPGLKPDCAKCDFSATLKRRFPLLKQEAPTDFHRRTIGMTPMNLSNPIKSCLTDD
jgi:hypothetical protein